MVLGRPIRILLVEDNPADVRWAQESLREGKLVNEMAVAHDGEEALAYLRGEGPYKNVPAPDLVLLDLNLPKRDGVEVLMEIRNDPALRDLAVAVLTTSKFHKDEILRKYGLKEDCFLEKPLDFARFLDALRCFEHLQLGIMTTQAS